MSNEFTLSTTKDLSHHVESIVAMAVYSEDRIDWLIEAVESILTQDYDNFIFMIVIDGPISVQMYDYLVDVTQQNHRVLLAQSDKNRGLSSCMNYAINFALENFTDVEFFFRMDSDDISEKHRLKRQVEYLRVHPDISILGTSLVEVDEKGRVVGKRLLPQEHQQIERSLPRRCTINHPTVVVRMSVFNDGFRYRQDLMNTQDYILWIDLCSSGFRFANLPDILLKFRRVNDFYKRRGLSKSLNELSARFLAMKKLKRYTFINVSYALSVIVLRLMPAKIIKLAYKLDRYVLNRRDKQ